MFGNILTLSGKVRGLKRFTSAFLYLSWCQPLDNKTIPSISNDGMSNRDLWRPKPMLTSRAWKECAQLPKIEVSKKCVPRERERLKYLDKEDPKLARYDSNTYKHIYNFINKGRIPHLQLPNDNDIFNVNICFLKKYTIRSKCESCQNYVAQNNVRDTSKMIFGYIRHIGVSCHEEYDVCQ